MIDANEYYLVEALKELGLEEDKIKKLVEKFEGWRIYFRKKNQKKRIVEFYFQMLDIGLNKEIAIKNLSCFFDKSESRIKAILKETNEYKEDFR